MSFCRIRYAALSYVWASPPYGVVYEKLTAIERMALGGFLLRTGPLTHIYSTYSIVSSISPLQHSGPPYPLHSFPSSAVFPVYVHSRQSHGRPNQLIGIEDATEQGGIKGSCII